MVFICCLSGLVQLFLSVPCCNIWRANLRIICGIKPSIIPWELHETNPTVTYTYNISKQSFILGFGVWLQSVWQNLCLRNKLQQTEEWFISKDWASLLIVWRNVYTAKLSKNPKTNSGDFTSFCKDLTTSVFSNREQLLDSIVGGIITTCNWVS